MDLSKNLFVSYLVGDLPVWFQICGGVVPEQNLIEILDQVAGIHSLFLLTSDLPVFSSDLNHLYGSGEI